MLKLVKMTTEDWTIFNGRSFHGTRALGRAQEVVAEFYDSNEPVMRVVWADGEYSSCGVVRNTLAKAAKTLGLEKSVKLRMAKDRLYIYSPSKIKEIEL